MIIDDKYTTTAGDTKKTNTQNQYERLCVFANLILVLVLYPFIFMY